MESSISKSVSLLVLLIVLVCQAIGFAEVVDIPDLNLRIALESYVGKEITKEALAGFGTELYIRNRGITNLSGLEHCTNVTGLNLERNQLTDLNGLAKIVQ